MSVECLSCAEQEKMIESAADYRACGASWEVVASHFEMPLAEVMAFIQANRQQFENTLRFVKMDREYERRARHRREMRRALKNAETVSSRAAAARAIVSHAMSQERVWLKQKMESQWRSAKRARAGSREGGPRCTEGNQAEGESSRVTAASRTRRSSRPGCPIAGAGRWTPARRTAGRCRKRRSSRPPEASACSPPGC